MSIRFENTRRQHASFSRCGHSVSSEKGKPGRGLRASGKLNPGNRLKTVQDCTVFCPATGHDDAWRLLPWKRSRNIASRTKTVNLKNLWIASRNSRHRRKPPEQKRPGERWTITPEKQAVRRVWGGHSLRLRSGQALSAAVAVEVALWISRTIPTNTQVLPEGRVWRGRPRPRPLILNSTSGREWGFEVSTGVRATFRKASWSRGYTKSKAASAGARATRLW